MGPPEELRTSYYPYECYPEHWGPFDLHKIFPLGHELRALEVHYFQMCVVVPNTGDTYYLGFDDYGPGWPVERELSPRAAKRRDMIRDAVQIRALVQVKKVKQLLPEGIELLRDAGADVSDAACSEGLWVAVHGKYWNYPLYNPDPRATRLIQLSFLYEFEEHTAERTLHIRSLDQRTAARCMLYFERIKLRKFMFDVSKEDDLRTPIEDRDIEWFIKKYMEKYRFNRAVLPEKQDNYRGARKHTSEVRHTFVCHAEWMLRYANLHKGSERVISTKVLTRWAENAPLMREMAVNEGRAGWGVWDYVWDKVDPLQWYNKEKLRLRHYINRVKREAKLTQDEDMQSSSEDDRPRRPFQANKKKSTGTSFDKGKGRATTEDDYRHTWIKQPSSDEEDDYGSWDDGPVGGSKRPRMDAYSSPSLGGSQQQAGPSGSRRPWSGSSPSLGGRGESDDVRRRAPQFSQPDAPNSSQSLGGWNPSQSQAQQSSSARRVLGAGPSYSQSQGSTSNARNQTGQPSRSAAHAGLSTWSGAGLGLSGSSYSGTDPDRSSATSPPGQSNQPDNQTRSSTRLANQSQTRSSSVRHTSPAPTRSLETRLSRLSTSPRSTEFIIVPSSSDDEVAPIKEERAPSYRAPYVDRHSVIEIHDTTSEEADDDQDMHEVDKLQEDDAGLETQAAAQVDQRQSVTSQRSIISETPPHTRPQRTGRLTSHPLTTMSEEEISDSQESMNSSDSESKYGRKDRRTPLTPAKLQRLKLIELNDRIIKFAPMAMYAPEQPSTWSPWKCNYPPLTLPITANVALAHKYKCVFMIDLLRPSLEMQRLLSETNDPMDSEFLKHLTTKPSVFTGPQDQLATAIFVRVVELHREDHFRTWGVKRVIKEAEDGTRLAHFEPL